MEHVNGVPLLDKWHSMKGQEHIRLIRSVGRFMRELGTLSFPAYGSLCFADGLAAHHPRIQLPNGYAIGPHCATDYWDCSNAEKKEYYYKGPNRGPCKSGFPCQLNDRGTNCYFLERV